MKRIEFFVGTEMDKNGEKIPDVSRVLLLERTRALVAAEFGGVTILNALGAWQNGDGNMVQERAINIVIFVEVATKAHAVAERLAKLWNQEMIVMTSQDVDLAWISQVAENKVA